MKKRLFLSIIVFLAIAGLLITIGCQQKPKEPTEDPTTMIDAGKPADTGKPPVEKKLKVGISLMNREQSFYKDLEEAFKETAEKEGIEVEIRDASFDSRKQLNGVETMLVGDVDAIILCPVDSQAGGAAVKAANSKNVPVFTVDITVDKGDVISHVASDNQAGGKKAAEYIAKLLDGKGNIIILDSPEVTSVQERVKGFEEELAKHPEMKVVSKIDGGALKGKAMKAMENLLQAHKKIDGVFAINDETALGALRAIEMAKRGDEIIIVGYDATPEARKQIMKGGALKADVVQYPKKMAKKAMEIVSVYLKTGEKPPKKIPMDVGILDKETLEKGEKVAPDKGEKKPDEKKPGDEIKVDEGKKPEEGKEIKDDKVPSADEEKKPEEGKKPGEGGKKE
ncbi:MAG: substrate-binding domain-containing protein [Candidatus Eremiobacteraeota bacterium]|nr:substrate-binding domain-containing protein [Candidatus Eremiobacteraeota bacterium]